MLSGAPESALTESESTLLSSSGVWEHLEVLRSTGEVARSVCDDCGWLLEPIYIVPMAIIPKHDTHNSRR